MMQKEIALDNLLNVLKNESATPSELSRSILGYESLGPGAIYSALYQQGDESLRIWYYLKSISSNYLIKFNNLFKEEIGHFTQLDIFEQIVGISFSHFPFIAILSFLL